jgi:hypothetical protein
MPDPVAAQPTIPDFRDKTRYPERPANHPQSYRDDFNLLIRTLAHEERQHPPEIAPRPLADDPKLSPQEYESRYREMRYGLRR